MDGSTVHIFYTHMNSYGFIRTAAAVPAIRLADPAYNAEEICRLIDKAIEEEVSLIVFPELALTGSTCGDLFTNSALLKGAAEGLDRIMCHIQKRFLEGKAGIDYRYVIGNHDMTNYGRSFETSMKNYGDMYGPAWYSFNVGDVHYIVLNDNFYVGRDYFYIGYIDERQLQWLERDLSYVQPGSRVVVSLHIQTTNDKSDRDAFQYGIIGDNLCNKPAFYSMLEPYKTTILSGHSHTADFEQISENIFEINVAGFCGAWWCGEVCIDGAPAGYKIFDMDGNEMEWIYKGCGHPLDYQVKVYTDHEWYPGQIVANVWDFDPEWKVEYYEDGVKVCDMERFKAQDPLAVELYKDPSSLKRSWVYAAPTENMFKATISEGAKTLEVRVTNRFGKTFTKTINR